MLDDALAVVDHSIQCNVREDGLYHAYNLLHIKSEAIEIGDLYLMLEGQVAALSSGAIAPARAVEVLDTLFESDIFRRRSGNLHVVSGSSVARISGEEPDTG